MIELSYLATTLRARDATAPGPASAATSKYGWAL